jgi:ribosomal protein L29
MAILKVNEISKMSEKERNSKIQDLKIELMRDKASAGKGGKMKTKEIKRTIARLLTFNRINSKESVEKK